MFERLKRFLHHRYGRWTWDEVLEHTHCPKDAQKTLWHFERGAYRSNACSQWASLYLRLARAKGWTDAETRDLYYKDAFGDWVAHAVVCGVWTCDGIQTTLYAMDKDYYVEHVYLGDALEHLAGKLGYMTEDQHQRELQRERDAADIEMLERYRDSQRERMT